MKKTFNLGTLFRDAWKDYKSNWKLFILVGIIFILLGLLGGIGSTVNQSTGLVEQSGIISLITWLLQIFVGLGYIRFLLNMVDGKEYKVEDLFKGAHSFEHFAYFAVVALLYTVFISFGTVLLVIPGLIALVGFTFSQYLIAEEKTDILGSFKESWNMTKGNRWKIFWLMIVVSFFNVFGLIAFIVGLVITIPMSSLIFIRLYRTLGNDNEETEEIQEEDIEIEVVEVLEGEHVEE